MQKFLGGKCTKQPKMQEMGVEKIKESVDFKKIKALEVSREFAIKAASAFPRLC